MKPCFPGSSQILALPMGNDVPIPHFALLVYTAFTLPTKVSPSQPMSFFALFCPSDSLPHTTAGEQSSSFLLVTPPLVLQLQN